MNKAIFSAVALLVVLFTGIASGEESKGFGKFQEETINLPGSFATIDDPTNEGPSSKVDSFWLKPGPCSDKKYEGGARSSGKSDCFYKSIRSQLYEEAKSQPSEAWYQWWMYLPKDFPVGKEQIGTGLYSFAYWHNGECPNLALVSETSFGGAKLSLQVNKYTSQGKFYCVPDVRIDLADLSALRGAWHRFEAHVRWAREQDVGQATVYLDGKLVALYKGHTLMIGGPKKNYFKYGVYLCCTKGTTEIAPAKAYFTGIKRAATRSEFFSDREREDVKKLEVVLSKLGCDVGAIDGIADEKTEEMALTCRAFADGKLPEDFGPANVGRFLALYSEKGIESLPRGVRKSKKVPAIKMNIIEAEAESVGDDPKINSNLKGSVKGKDMPKAVDFLLVGNYGSVAKSVEDLEIILVGDLGAPSDKLKRCPGIRFEKWQDGSNHAVIQFMKIGKKYIPTGAACIVASLPKPFISEAEFVTSHLGDVAVSMVANGSANLVKHNGLKALLNQIADGELAVSRD